MNGDKTQSKNTGDMAQREEVKIAQGHLQKKLSKFISLIIPFHKAFVA